jgi:hypothetical protein
MTKIPYPYADSLTRHHYPLADWRGTEAEAQRHAERDGHVPPAVRPVYVKSWNFTTDFAWQCLWFADGPWAGTSRMIEAEADKGDRVIFPTFDRVDDLVPGDKSPAAYTYEVDQREDGLWFGRWVA